VNKGLSNLPLGIFLLFGDPRGGHQNFRSGCAPSP
jgi:hypothetical protein